MRAILIDPYTCTITETTIGQNLLSECYATLECELIEFAYMSDCSIIVDEEGLYRQRRYFMFQGQILAGRGLVVGRNPDDEGECTGTKLTVEEVEARVRWGNPNAVAALREQT